MASAALIQAPPQASTGYRGYGAALDLWRYKGHEVLIEGAYETGKTLACLHKINALCCKYPNVRVLIVRKTYKSLIQSVVVTYETKVLAYPPKDPRQPVNVFGGSKPEWYEYPNGSRIVLAGMDNPDKALSAEYDFAYINQLEELTENEYETLLGRVTGRAANSPYPQVMADCNPKHPEHWILKRDRLKRFKSRHEDNPTLFDQKTGEMTERGKLTMSILDSLTGVRYKRGRLGLWAGAENQVYEGFNDAIHIIEPFDIPDDWQKFRSIDFGYRNPFVCQWWAIDHDGRLYLYRELYRTNVLVEDHAKRIVELSQGESISETIADHDAQERATLARYGVPTIAAKKDIVIGVQAVESRLAVQGDGKPRLFIMRDCLVDEDPHLIEARLPTHTAAEIPEYVYKENSATKNADELPVKNNDHGVDAMRYMVMHLDSKTKKRRGYVANA